MIARLETVREDPAQAFVKGDEIGSPRRQESPGKVRQARQALLVVSASSEPVMVDTDGHG
jgi:hypothetical protein